MAWREYVDPTTNEWWTTDDAGNFIPGRSAGERNTNPAQSLPSPAVAPSGNWQGLWNALTGSNQQQFDFMKQESGQSLAEKQREFDQTLAFQKEQEAAAQQQAARNQYQSLAQNLLVGASALRGPADWLNYANYTSGGRNIFQSLYGNQPVPSFGAPSGNSAPVSIWDVLQQLGVPGAPQGAGQSPAAPTGQPPSQGPTGQGSGVWQLPATADWSGIQRGLDSWANDFNQRNHRWPSQAEWLSQIQSALQPIGAPSGLAQSFLDVMNANNRQVGTMFPGLQQRPGPDVLNWLGPAYQNWAKAQPQQQPLAQSLQQATAPVTGAHNIMQTAPGNIGAIGGGPVKTQPYPAGGPPGPTSGPLPYQINPMVWDSLSGTAKQMILASAQAGNTPSGVWDPADFMSQLNAARPKGNAPTSVTMQYGQPQSLF